MRGLETRIREIRHRIFREVARMAYHTEWPVDKRIEELPYKIIPGEVSRFRNDVFLELSLIHICFTNECLRDYILRYFGEYGNNYCGNCVNCLTQFETIDITEAAGYILTCVEKSRQRYGTNVIIDTVHGANTAKIRGYRMDENPCYGKLSKMPAYRPVSYTHLAGRGCPEHSDCLLWRRAGKLRV